MASIDIVYVLSYTVKWQLLGMMSLVIDNCLVTFPSPLTKLTHWPLGDLKEILFKQIEAEFRDWWLGYL